MKTYTAKTRIGQHLRDVQVTAPNIHEAREQIKQIYSSKEVVNLREA